MLDKKVADLLNDQINKEMYSAYLYLDFANFYTHKGLNGYANWYNVTSLIHNIYDAAHSVKDYRTMKFLDWYVSEQGEEEKNATELITQFELFGHDPKSLYSLNNELMQRTYTQSSILFTE